MSILSIQSKLGPSFIMDTIDMQSENICTQGDLSHVVR